VVEGDLSGLSRETWLSKKRCIPLDVRTTIEDKLRRIDQGMQKLRKGMISIEPHEKLENRYTKDNLQV
jgi:hypothetical protein